MGIVLARMDRVLWVADLFSVMIILVVSAKLLARVGHRVQLCLGAAFALVYIVWAAELLRWNSLVAQENLYVEASCGPRRPTAPTIAFTRHIAQDSIPYWLMGIPGNPLEVDMGDFFLGSHIHHGMATAMVLPDSLRDLPFEKWPKVPGRNHFRGVWPMIAAADSLPRDQIIRVHGTGANLTPIDRLLVWVKEGSGEHDAEIHCYSIIRPVFLPDGTKVYRYRTEMLPRTIVRRPFVGVDTTAVRRRE